MKLFIQLDKENYITDCIEYSYSNYQEVEFDLPLPLAFISGCYKYLGDNKYERDEEKWKALNDSIEDSEII